MDALETYRSFDAISDYADRSRVANLAARFMAIKLSANKMQMMQMVAEQEGIPRKTIERKYYAWLKSGDAGIADKRKMKRASNAGSVYYPDFTAYCERDRNTSRGGYETMLRELRQGVPMKCGTWRDAWKRDFPAERVPPVCPSGYVPKGFTYSNMMRLYKADPRRAMSLAWTRQGQFAASAHALPVVRSREGLAVGAVYQADDVWHNVDVFAPGLKGTFQPLEFAFYDVASAYKAVSAIKPRSYVVDKTTGREVRDNLKEVQFRYAVAHLMCEVGFHKDGVTLVGERGTSALRETVLKRIAAVPGFGKLFHWKQSGLLNTPAHKGILMGNAGGNPRMKALCECAHNILHNATASIKGNRGRDAAHMHESREAVVKYSRDMIEQASRIDPKIVPLLQLPILDFRTYLQYFSAMEDEVMDRTRHDLEGWAANFVMEFRLSEQSEDWLNVETIGSMNPAQREAVKAVIAQNPAALMRQRKMSRREVWKAGQGSLIRWPLFEAPAFLDPRDAREATVRADGTIGFTDGVYSPGVENLYIAQYVSRGGTPMRIPAGEKVRFYWIPVGGMVKQIWIADEADNILGMAPLLKTAAWRDPSTLAAALGQKMHHVAEIMAETRFNHADEASRRIAAEAWNTALIASASRSMNRVELPGEAATLAELAAPAPGETPPPPPQEESAAEGEAALEFLASVNTL